MKTAPYPPGLLTLAVAHQHLQLDRRFGVCREELLTYIDRCGRPSSAKRRDNGYAVPDWNGGASSSTRKVFKFLLRMFKVSENCRFINFGKRAVSRDGFVRIYREEMQNMLGLGSTAVGIALRRLEALNIISRQHMHDEDGHKHTFFRLNPEAIYKALDALRGFRLTGKEGKTRDAQAEPSPAVPGTKTEGPQSNPAPVLETEDETAKNTAEKPAFSAPEPLTDLRRVFSLPGSGFSGVAGLAAEGHPGPPDVTPGVVVDGAVLDVPDAPCHQDGERERAAAAPAGVFSPKKGTPATSEPEGGGTTFFSRVSRKLRASRLGADGSFFTAWMNTKPKPIAPAPVPPLPGTPLPAMARNRIFQPPNIFAAAQ